MPPRVGKANCFASCGADAFISVTEQRRGEGVIAVPLLTWRASVMVPREDFDKTGSGNLIVGKMLHGFSWERGMLLYT